MTSLRDYAVSLAILVCIAKCMPAADSASEIYARRILPIIESSDRSSCSECHLRGVELKDFLSSDAAATFSALRGRGWIDVTAPEKSKLLEFISKQPDKGDPLLEKVRQAELAAVKQWLLAAVADPQLLAAKPTPLKDLELPLDFIRHARSDQMTARFADAVWSQLGRCVNCHSPERNAKQVKEHGAQMSWIVPSDPAATLKLLVERDLIDIAKPEDSQLRTKPLVIVEHGGGPKFVPGSETDRRWLEFLQDYSRSARADGYQVGDTLPALPQYRSWLSELQIRITDLPSAWNDRVMTVTLHRLNPDGKIDPRPAARGDSRVNPKQQVWQNALTLYALKPQSQGTSTRQWAQPLAVADSITEGEYVLQVALRSTTSEPELVGTFRLTAPWPPGYQPPKILSWHQHQP